VRALLVATALSCLALATVPHATAQTSPRPNIVVLMTDDQTRDSMRVLPKTRRLLGDRGATFLNSFASLPLCCPSRATFLTGQYAHNHGVFTNTPPGGGYAGLNNSNTLAVWLQRAGYATVHVGRYLNGYGLVDPMEIPPGWSGWHGSVGSSSFHYYGYTLNENGRLVTYERTYQTDLYARKAVGVIRRRASQRKPFFLWVAFLAPHSGPPRDPDDPDEFKTPAPAPRHRDYFAGTPLPKPPGFNERDVSDKPTLIRKRPRLTRDQLPGLEEKYQQRLETLLAVDEAVARIVRTLRETGELTNTLIVFTSDNGFFHGEHRVPTGKKLLYEPSIRVPLIMRGPGIPAGLRLRQPVANIDLAPTFVQVAEATPGLTMDGSSLLTLFANPVTELNRDLVIENAPGAKNFAAIRTERYLYAEYASGERELYDLIQDPFQLKSLHADPAYDAVEQELAVRLAWARSCTGDACRTRP
jgi:N-acetylglucosamine-6-sulfatase